jgi:hypothetical protein
MIYARYMRGRDILDKVFYSDEASFQISAYANGQNNRVWSDENQHNLHEKQLHTLKFGVWCAESQ